MGSTSDNSPVFSASDQSYSTPPATPMNRRERAMTDSLCPRQHPFDIRSPSELSLKSPLSVDVDMDMDCDEDETTVPPLSSSTVTPRNSRLSISVQKASNKAKSAREGVETMGINSSSSASSVTSSPSITKTTLRKTGLDGSTNGKEWTRQIVPPPLHPAVQYAHPPYVASYYTAPNVQLIPGPNGFTAMSAMAAGMPPAGMMAVPRNPHAILPATSGPNSKPMATAARTSRQFAPIRPRTPMVSEEDSKGRTASTNPEPAKKKGTVASSEPKTLSQPPKLRPLVPNYAPGAHGAMAHPPHFLTHAPVPGHAHPGAPTRLYIPVIPVVYNKPPATMVSPGPAAGKAPSKPSGPAKIAPRLHRPT
ncbi:hypothetical protein BGW38_010842 [Lunasporangiospora selenospora]|uniref:Uncharacterized protein n=1 Tax=Lunasporangiospora selenospora TaxID=979761 RepID=A0A9P6FVP6_9FUNG|nr:hypothetical protein BGW38_010842 [Lunasporangiospora selenospora]